MLFSKTTYTRVGNFLKPQGTNGELRVDVDDKFWDDVIQGDHLFIKYNGNFIPYFVEYFREANHLLVKLEDIDTPESAAFFTLKEAFFRDKDINSDTGTITLSKMGWEGYFVLNNGVIIGQITEIQEFPLQIMAFVNDSDKNFMIPLVTEWIIDINDDDKIIQMKLPDGLVEM